MSNPNNKNQPPSSGRPPPPPADALPSTTQEASTQSSTGFSKEDMERVFKDMAERMGLAVGVALKSNGVGGSGNQARSVSPLATQDEGVGGQCSECQQQVKACKRKHVQMVVYPRNPRFERWFHGLQTNGINYRSNGSGHAITVPADNDFPHRLSMFEAEEEANLMGRVFQHNSGAIGPSAAAHGGFRGVDQSFQDRHIVR